MQQYTTVTDHYAYQSLASIGVLVAVAVDRFDRVKYAAGVLALVFAVMTFLQANRWHDQQKFLIWSAELYPRAVMPRTALAIGCINSGDFVAGEHYAREAVELRQRAVDCAMLSESLYALNRPDEADTMARLALSRGLFDKVCLSRLTPVARRAKRLDVALELARRWVEAEPRNFGAIKMMDEIAVERNRSATRPATTQAVQ